MNIEITEEQKIRILNSQMLYDVMKEVLLRENQIEREAEHVWTVAMRADNKILNIELSSLGTVDAAMVKPMQVFRIALIKGAVRLIMVHNHPADLLVPSQNDKDITDRMIQVGKIIGVEVLDHLLISDKGFLSFEDKGIMEELRRSNKFAPTFIEMDRIKKEALRIGKKEGEKKGLKKGKEIGLERGIKKGEKLGEKRGLEKGKIEGKIEGKKEGLKEGLEKGKKEIAKNMKKEGIPQDVIARATGLTIKEIDKI